MIYSTQFFQGTLESGNVSLFTVPSGHVYVVRDVALTPFSGSSPDRVTLYIGGSGGGFLLSSVDQVLGDTLHETGYWVLEAGQTLAAHSDGREYRAVISGYDLVNY
jgi:hypothetical protein